jgi:hypothetical protein
VDVLVTAAPGKQPAAASDLVGQRVDRGVRDALPVDRQFEIGERIAPVRIAPMLADDQLRAEFPQQRRDHGVKGPQPAGIPVPAGSATLTAAPSASEPPVSVAYPVPGNKVSGCSWPAHPPSPP